ncbi:MAG TPA: 16S rRNA (cytosine(967)-C(5))-methyltransferase RsmB [Candidatus Acidoferrales bacterium]|jgi:16S rRNA (cytosine967-C5)-methyltransferase|nr:16S rRNA (cytosine(967)-C(5))-methyltransferase RsmB [Candidatus Acidoferrales bacterium]
MTISQARTIAFDVLLRVTKQNAYADDVLRALLSDSVKTEDAGLATELALGVLRWQRLLDFLIDRYLKKPADVTDAEVRIALRMGFYQLYFLSRVPAHAAVHESVELVKRARKRSAANLVNAILRKAAKERRDDISPPDAVAHLLPAATSHADRLGIRYSHPTWMVERWIRTYGEEHTRELLQANNHVPALSGYLLDPKRDEEVRSLFRNTKTTILPGKLLRDAWVLEGGNPSACAAVRDGWIALQDEASQAVARLLAVEPGQTVLDLCAAPGGKTLLLARAAGEQGRVIAADLHANRVRAMKERFERGGVRNVETFVLDGAETLPNSKPFEQGFDRILVDVPCSGTGTLARHPEIRWKLGAADIGDLHSRQVRLLRNALRHLSAGGRLVYSTCSLEPEENELVVREALQEAGGDFHTIDPRMAIESGLQESVAVKSVVDVEGFFRTFPSEHGTDGFFGVVIERQEPKN